MTRVKRVSVIGEPIFMDGQQYSLTKIKNICTKCGGDRVELAHCFKSDFTEKVHRVWKCWDCDVNYDTVQVAKTKEGAFIV